MTRWGEGDKNWGVIVTGNIDTQFAMPNGAGDMIIDQGCKPEGERFEKFKELSTAAKANGSLIVGQITHPGRQVKYSLSSEAVSASDVQLCESNPFLYVSGGVLT
jgi:2,4-dienoyl-CoA reductase-like NADH-dependent reductase (Old Yellow Enzyme family)